MTPVVIDQCQQPTIHFSKMGTHRLGPLRFAFPPRRGSSWFTPLEPASAGMRASHERISLTMHLHAYRAYFVTTRVPDRTLALDGTRPSDAVCVHRLRPRLAVTEVTESSGLPRWSRPSSPRRVNGTRIRIGPKHLRLPLHVGTPHGRGHARRSRLPIRRTGGSSLRATGESLQCFNRPWALDVPSTPASRLTPALLRRGSPSGGSTRTVEPSVQGTELRRGEPLHRSAPLSTSSRHPRRRFVILEVWVSSTSSEPAQVISFPREVPDQVPSTTDDTNDRSRSHAGHRERCPRYLLDRSDEDP